jgi:RimJ/RimL family protein N-acetyltransferase
MADWLFCETTRLRLRRFEERDAPALAAYRSDPEVARFQSWSALDEEAARTFIADARLLPPGLPGQGYQVAVALREGDTLIGDCFFRLVDYDPRQAEIGYSFARARQGQGYASEAVRALLGRAFGVLGLHRVIAYVVAPNLRSVALLERVGLRREGHLRRSFEVGGEWLDEYLYAILAEEWRG